MGVIEGTAVGATARLARRICALGYDDLGGAAVEAVKRLIADGIAVAIAGSREAAPQIVFDHVRDTGAKAEATVWSASLRTSAQLAAYANAVAMHVLDFEPMSSPSTHAVSPTLPVALALAESCGASGREVLVACAKGLEIQGRLLVASSHARGALPFHTPGVVGVMGAAVTAAHLLKLDEVALAHALGIAASRCSGLPANTGSMVKCTHCGNAAAAGLEAALLASRGFTAHPGIIEAPRGYVETFFPAHFDYDVLLSFARPWRFVDPGIAIKFFPSKYPTHFAIGAALELRKQIPDAAQIAILRLVTPEIEDADRPSPRSGLEGKFSFQYTAAAALLDGRIGIDSFTDERRFAPDMTALLDRITLTRDTEIPRDTRRMRVAIQAVLTDGRSYRAVCSKPPGFWGEPVNREQHCAKLRDCLGVRLDEPRIVLVLDRVAAVEALSADEVGALIALLA
jgi:2-methylcitrate dehydratase PrpD